MVWKPFKENENCEFKSVQHRLKLTLCHILFVRRGWLIHRLCEHSHRVNSAKQLSVSRLCIHQAETWMRRRETESCQAPLTLCLRYHNLHFINAIERSLFINIANFWDASQTTIFDLPRKVWRIKTQNNLRNLFSPKLLKTSF